MVASASKSILTCIRLHRDAITVVDNLLDIIGMYEESQ